jgi:hypothetical protein
MSEARRHEPEPLVNANDKLLNFA